MRQELIEASDGKYKTSFELERVKMAEERKTMPKFVRELIKKYENRESSNKKNKRK